MGRSEKPLCIDLYCPTHLENLAAGHASEVAHQVSLLNDDLARADFVLCASERQRDFWLGALGAVGRLNPLTYGADPTLRSLVDVVPFGLEPTGPPVPTDRLRARFPAIATGDPVLVWGGGVYDWFDPLTLVEAVAGLRVRWPRIRLVFLGMRNPNPEIPDGHMESTVRRRATELRLTGTHVFFNEGWIPYAERGEFLARADVGVSCHPAHVEARFSFRTRVLDYLWAELPMVLTEGDVLSEAVAAAGVGRAVPPGDVDALADAIDAVLHAPPSLDSIRAFGAAYAWPVVAAPLTAWARDGGRAADRPRTAPPEHSPPPAPARPRRRLRAIRSRGGS
jgi:hypothetical protein